MFSHCSASHFYLLAQIKVTKTKGTLSCADATHRCPARLRPQAGQPETRRAARDSDIRLSYPLAASTARRCAQGDPIQAGSLSLAQGRACCVGLGFSLIRRERSRWVRSGSVGALVSVVGRVSVFVPRCAATETRSGEGFPAHCAGAARCLSIAKAMRVFAASLRREHQSAPARSAGAVPGCLFPLLTFFWTSKRK